MKHIIILATTLLFLRPTFSQFQLSHGTQGDESGLSIRKTYFDKGYVIGGFSDFKFMPGYNAIITKTKSNGVIDWSMVYGGDGSDYFYSVRPIDPFADKGFVALGSTNSFGAGAFDMLFVRTDNSGTPVSVFTYGGDKYEGGSCIQVVKNPRTGKSELVMIGHSSSYFPVIDNKMFIVKTTLLGKYLDAVVFADEGYHSGYWIEQTSDGGFIAVGTTSNSCCCGHTAGVENYDVFVVKLNYYLDVEWARTLGGESGLYDTEAAHSVKETKDGFIITGYTESFSVDGKDAFILKLDHYGGFMWMRNYGYKGDDIGNDILNVEDYGMKYQYIINGKTSVNGTDYAFLLATDTKGNLIWNRGYGMLNDEAGNELERNGKEGYVFTGSVKSFGEGQRDVYQVLTDNYGNSFCPNCEIEAEFKSEYYQPCIKKEFKYEHVQTGLEYEIKYENIGLETHSCPEDSLSQTKSSVNLKSGIRTFASLEIYPNPAKERINIIYPDNYRYGIINIYNSTGQLVLSKELSGLEFIDLSVSELNNGFYLISIMNEDGEYLTANLLKKN